MQFGLSKLPSISAEVASSKLLEATTDIKRDLQNAGLNLNIWMTHSPVFRNCVAVTGCLNGDDTLTFKKIVGATELKYTTVQVIHELSHETIARSIGAD